MSKRVEKRIWALYIDESGNFCRLDGRVDIAGLLIDLDWRGCTPGALRAALQARAPHVPWPLHARELFQPVLHAIWYANSQQCGLDSTLRERALLVCQELRASAPRTFDAVEERIQTRKSPRMDEVSALGNYFKTQEDTSVWQAVADDTWRKLGELLQDLHALPDAPQHLAWFIASDPAFPRLRQPDCEPDRYRALLPAFLERVVDHLIQIGGQHTVRVRACELDVFDPLIGRNRPLSTADLGRLIRQSACPRPYIAAGGQVDLVADHPARFDRDADAHHVLADFAATRGRECFTGNSREEILQAFEQRCHCLPAIAQRVCANGPPQVHINQARRHHDYQAPPPPLFLPPIRSWTEEDARIWAPIVAQH